MILGIADIRRKIHKWGCIGENNQLNLEKSTHYTEHNRYTKENNKKN